MFLWCKFYAHFNILLKPLSSFCMQLLLAMLMWYDGILCRPSPAHSHTYNSHTFEHVHTNDRESCVEEPNYNPHIYEKGGAKSTITWILKTN